MLPAVVNDTPGADEFVDWTIHPLQSVPDRGKFVGKVTARRRGDNLIYWSEFAVYGDDLEQPPAQLFTLLDQLVKSAVEFIVNYNLPHRDDRLCEHNSFCEVCYA